MNLFFQSNGFQGIAYGNDQAVHIQRLDDIIIGAELHCGYDGLNVLEGRNHDDQYVRIIRLDFMDCFDAAHPRQSDIQQNKVGTPFRQGRQGIFGCSEAIDLVSALQRQGDACSGYVFIVDDKQGKRRHLGNFLLSTGNITVKQAPPRSPEPTCKVPL